MANKQQSTATPETTVINEVVETPNNGVENNFDNVDTPDEQDEKYLAELVRGNESEKLKALQQELIDIDGKIFEAFKNKASLAEKSKLYERQAAIPKEIELEIREIVKQKAEAARKVEESRVITVKVTAYQAFFALETAIAQEAPKEAIEALQVAFNAANDALDNELIKKASVVRSESNGSKATGKKEDALAQFEANKVAGLSESDAKKELYTKQGYAESSVHSWIKL